MVTTTNKRKHKRPVRRVSMRNNKNKHFLLTKLNLVQGGGLPSNWVLITALTDVTRVGLAPPAHR